MIGYKGIQINEKIGENEVIYSGTLHSHKEYKSVSIVISGLTILFEFSTEGDSKKESIIIQGHGAELTIKCVNFANMFGSGPITPLKIGTLNSRGLYLSFMVYTYSNDIRLIHYCLFYGN